MTVLTGLGSYIKWVVPKWLSCSDGVITAGDIYNNFPMAIENCYY